MKVPYNMLQIHFQTGDIVMKRDDSAVIVVLHKDLRHIFLYKQLNIQTISSSLGVVLLSSSLDIADARLSFSSDTDLRSGDLPNNRG